MKTYVVSGLGFGNEGKGSAVDYLARTMNDPLVIRATGGPQSRHNVVLPDGKHHSFSHFGSGTFAGAKTIYAGIVCDPYGACREAEILTGKVSDPKKLISFSEECLVTTPYHQAFNRLIESERGRDRYGTCGLGINETVSLARKGIGLCVGDIMNRDGDLGRKLGAIRSHYEDKIALLVEHFSLDSEESGELLDFILSEETSAYVMGQLKEFVGSFQIVSNKDIYRRISESKSKIFEGASGVLLDPKHGLFFPHVTRLSDFDVRRFLTSEKYTHVLCTRTYMNRHGRGPLPSYDQRIEAYDRHNTPNDWQGTMRYGHLDIPLLRYARDIVRKNGMYSDPKLFISHADVINSGSIVTEYSGRENITKVITDCSDASSVLRSDSAIGLFNSAMMDLELSYEESEDHCSEIGSRLRIPVGWISRGDTFADKERL